MIEHMIGPMSWATWTIEDLANAYAVPTRCKEHTDFMEQYFAQRNDPAWSGVRNLDEARDMLRAGWRTGAERIAVLREGVLDLPMAKSRKRVRHTADHGDELRIDEAIAGNWDNAWTTHARVIKSGNTYVDLTCFVGGNVHRSQEELFWRGATALMITDVLESAGYAVSLNLVHAAKFNWSANSPEWGRIDIPAKRADEPLRMDALAALTSPAILRSLIFRAVETFPGCDTGHGSSEQSAQTLPAALALAPDQIVLSASVFTKDAAIAEVKRVIKQVQGESQS